MGFSRYRKKYITVQEMIQHLKYVEKYFYIQYRAKREDETFRRNAYIEDKEVNFCLSYKKGDYACTYICRKDGSEDCQQTDGGEAFRILSQYYKVPRMDEDICGKADEGGLSASPIIWYNPKFNKTRQEAIGYDLNSAYSMAMLGPMPDTSKPPRQGIIEEGKEIGFIEVLNPKKNNEATMLEATYSGYSNIIYPLMPSPFTRFVENWYHKKANSLPGSKEKTKAKGVLNFAVGQLQNVNPFLRATIVCRCNELIKSIINPETTLFCNTDSIVSTVPIPELKLGTGIGEWKIEHTGKVAYVGNNYQWNDDPPSYRSISKKWFPKGWDILKDPNPRNGNIWEFNKEKFTLVLRGK